MYDTCLDTNFFTFNLPGGCGLVSDTHRVWITRLPSQTRGTDSRPRWLQSARAPLQRQAPRHSVRLWSLRPHALMSGRPPGSWWPWSRCCCHDSMLGLTTPSEVRTRRAGREAIIRRQWGAEAEAVSRLVTITGSVSFSAQEPWCITITSCWSWRLSPSD